MSTANTAGSDLFTSLPIAPPATMARAIDWGMSLDDLRKEYRQSALERDDLGPDPLVVFRRWLEQAVSAGMIEPNAMALATSDADGRVSTRMVLLKDVSEDGLTFFSNYRSRKARDLEQNPRAALLFYWDALERQVRFEGEVGKVSPETSDAYFRSRPYGSQLGAWASPQSGVIGSREELAAKIAELAARYPEGAVPRPPFWGGYRLWHDTVEFWQGRESRLHDRFRYRRKEDGWQIERLAP